MINRVLQKEREENYHYNLGIGDLKERFYNAQQYVPNNEFNRAPDVMQPLYELDAYTMTHDYYTHHLNNYDQDNVLIMFGNSIYKHNVKCNTHKLLFQTKAKNQYTSVIVNPLNNNQYVVNTNKNQLVLYRDEEKKTKKTYKTINSQVYTMDWYNHKLVTGDTQGVLIQRDFRCRQPIFSKMQCTSRICSLKWNKTGTTLAIGQEDDKVVLYDSRTETIRSEFTQHNAAVKAIDWCPWDSRLIMTGGGYSDQRAYIWNTETNGIVQHYHTNAQVTSVKFVEQDKQTIITNGYSKDKGLQGNITVWDYKTQQNIKVGYKTQQNIKVEYEDAILSSCFTPSGHLITLSNDESIRSWNMINTIQKKKQISSIKSSLCIR